MSYLLNREGPVVGISAADAAAGWRVLMTPDWRAAATDGAALANVTFGNDFNRNCKVWSFADANSKRIVLGDANSFLKMPAHTLSFVKFKFMWGQRAHATATNDVRWIGRAIQSQTGSQILNSTDADVRDVAGYVTSQEPAQYAYKIEELTITLSSWEDRPTMLIFGRNGSAGTDNMSDAALVYGIQVLVK